MEAMQYEKVDTYLTRFKVPNGWIYQSIFQNEVSMVFVPEFIQPIISSNTSKEIEIIWDAIVDLTNKIDQIAKSKTQ